MISYVSPFFSITITGIIALIISLGVTLALARSGRSRPFYLLLLVMHILASFSFVAITIGEPADAHRYYAESEWVRQFGIGTQFITFLLGWIREVTRLTFMDSFLIFQIPGISGILLAHRATTFFAVSEFGVKPAILSILFLLPGLHFWTSSIGKDSLAIFSYGLITTGLLYVRPNLILVGGGLALFFLIRPHISFLILLSMAIAFIPTFGRVHAGFRFIGLGSVVALTLMVPFMVLLLGIEGELIEGGREYLERRQNLDFRGGSAFDLSAMTPAERLVTVLYRPFFIDADGLFGILASIENFILLIISIYIIFNIRLLAILFKNSPFLRFHTIFLIIFVAVVSQTTGNLGLAVRYKMMMLPALFLILIAIVSFHARVRANRRKLLEEQLDDPQASTASGAMTDS